VQLFLVVVLIHMLFNVQKLHMSNVISEQDDDDDDDVVQTALFLSYKLSVRLSVRDAGDL